MDILTEKESLCRLGKREVMWGANKGFSNSGDDGDLGGRKKNRVETTKFQRVEGVYVGGGYQMGMKSVASQKGASKQEEAIPPLPETPDCGWGSKERGGCGGQAARGEKKSKVCNLGE